MRKATVNDQWRSLLRLKEVVRESKISGNDYAKYFTSVDRISELQEITYLVTSSLEKFSPKSQGQREQLLGEIRVLRIFLVDLVNEFEGKIGELEALGIGLNISQKPPPMKNEAPAEEQIDSVPPHISDKFLRSNFPALSPLSEQELQGRDARTERIFVLPVPDGCGENSAEQSEPKNLNCEISSKKNRCKLLSHDEKLEFEELLIAALGFGIRVEDTREGISGSVFISLTDPPTEAAGRVLLRLVELGLDIWPGKHFLDRLRF